MRPAVMFLTAVMAGAACTGGYPARAPGSYTSPAVTPVSPAPSSVRLPFAFRSTRFTADPVTSRSGEAAAMSAGAAVQDALTGFYDAGFADPASWGVPLPPEAWLVFDGSVRDRARRDAASLTLGRLGAQIEELAFTRSDLRVRVLVDQNGQPQAALATVAVEGSATRSGGGSLLLMNLATFILEPRAGSWLIEGYPLASTVAEDAS